MESHYARNLDFGRPSLPSMSYDDGFRGPFAFARRPNPFDDSISPPTASRPMSIRGSGNGINAPPPLPPPRLIPMGGPTDPTLRHKQFPPRREFEGASSDPLDHLSFKRRGSVLRPDIPDEGCHSIDTRSPKELQSAFGLHSIKHYRPNGDAIDRSMVSKLDGRKRGENRSPPRHSSLSSPKNDAPRTRAVHTQLSQLSLPHRAKVLDSANGFTHSPLLMSAASPGIPAFSQVSGADYRSPIGNDVVDLERSPLARNRRTNSGSVADDATVSTQGSLEMVRDDEPDFPVEETSRLRTLNIEDAWRERERERDRECMQAAAGQKRRASSPLPEDLPLDMFRRRDGSIVSRGSPTPRLQVIPQGSVSSVSSLRSGSYVSNLTASSMTSINSFGRHSPNGLSSGGLSPTETVSSPFAPPISVTTSPRGSMSRAAVTQAGQPRAMSIDTRTLIPSRKFAEYPKSSNGSSVVAKLKDPFMCQCCPKKPKKFDTEEELNIHAAEKQYECNFCGSRFKNKNEAERHQNSLHVRRHSWSCSALTGYERAFHDSTTRPGEADACGYCGEEFARTGVSAGPNHGVRFIADQDWEGRIRHLQDKHKFRECNSSKKFYRADHFRQHLKHSHAGTSGKWTNMLENACMIEEEQE